MYFCNKTITHPPWNILPASRPTGSPVIRMGITLWMNFHLKTAAFHWIVRIRRFELRNDVSSILCELSLECHFVSWNDEGSENVSCFEDWSNTLIRICLFHSSCPKRSHQFSLLISLTMFINFESAPLDQMTENIRLEWCFILCLEFVVELN